jgi:uncharacterized protein (DUF362 family)/ferredoxin
MEKHVVALVKCRSFSYDDRAVDDAVRRAVDLVGGIAQFVRPGQRVLIKPNLLMAAAPHRAVCTHPSVVKSVVHLVQEAGGHAVIGDSPGGPFRSVWLQAVYQRSGMTQVAIETGAELNSDFGETLLPHPEGRRVKALDVGTYVTSADAVISLPKLKTHGFMQLTGATKNLFGVIPGTVKAGYHAKLPKPEDFGDMLIDILTLIRPSLTIIDGIVGMDGQGPSAGARFELGAILAGADAIAVDVIAASLVGMKVRSIYPLRAAIARGLTSGEVADIHVVGDALSGLVVHDFRPPPTHTTNGHAIAMLGRAVQKWFVISPRCTSRCTGCGVCVENCPVQAIELVGGRARIDLDICIRCYCCHELCPEQAIDLHKPWIGRLIG